MQMSIYDAVEEGEYYTIPPIETISHVESISNFVIGRRGYGSITFTAPINLTGVSTLSHLREIIVFQNAYVAVYPYASDEPTVGFGINVQAQVCLENVRPSGIEMEEFITKLKEKSHTEFISYDMENGAWTFNIEHFSTYDDYSMDHSTSYPRMQCARCEISTSSDSSPSSSPHQHPLFAPASYISPLAAYRSQQSTNLEKRGLECLRTTSPSVCETSNAPSNQQLRSSTQYYYKEQYLPRFAKLLKAFNDVYVPFNEGKPIPTAARERLDDFTLDSDQFHRLITARELPKSRYIYLDEGKIKFDEWTQPPHAEVIGEVLVQVAMQDRPFRLFDCGTGGDVNLVPGSDKQPDGHWVVNTNRLPNTQQDLNTFPLNRATGEVAPQLVLEVAVSHESMPTLVDTDLVKYFAPGTGTRAWIGIKVFKSSSPNGTHRWWAGWAKRRIVNGQFLNQSELSQESMPNVDTNNVPITQPTNLVFHIDMFTLIHPCQRPANYPATIDINLEDVRQVILRHS